jgi:hypothetical protein
MAVSSRRFKSKYNIARLIDELQKMCLGTLFVAEDGVITFELYEAAASAVRTLTEDDVFEVRVETTYGNLVNRIAFLLADSTELYQGGWTMKDTASETNFTPPSGSAYVAEATVEFGLLKPRFKPAAPIFTTSAADIKLKDGDIMSLCGMRGSDNPGSQPADAKISAARPLYLRIATEIIKETTALTINTTDGQAFPVTVDENGKVSTTAGTGYYSSCTLASGGMTRASLGTTAVWHPDASDLDNGDVISWKTFQSEQPIQDLTIPERWGRLQLARFSNGCPILSFKTSLRHYDLQIGDVIALEHQLYAHYGDVEADSNTTWEIINKEVDLMKGECYFKVARIARTGGTSVTAGYVMISPLNAQSATHSMLRAQQQLRGGQAYIQGMKLATGSGLTFTVDKGTACIGAQVYRYPEKITFTVAASKDTYVYVDQFNGSIVMNAVNNGAARPTNDENWIIIGKVVSGGASTSSVVQMQNQAPFTQSQVSLDTSMKNLVKNGNFSGWGAGGLRPPDGWFYRTGSSLLATDPGVATPSTWDTTQVTRVLGESATGGNSIKFIQPTSGTNYCQELWQTDLTPIENVSMYAASYDRLSTTSAASYGTDAEWGFQVAYYDANKAFISIGAFNQLYGEDTGAYSLLIGNREAPYIEAKVPAAVSTSARYARFGFVVNWVGTAVGTYVACVDNIQVWKAYPKANLHRTTNATGIATGTPTTVDFSVEDPHYASDFGAGYAAGVYTVPITGTYKFTANVDVDDIGDGKQATLWLYDNSGNQLRKMGQAVNGTGGTADLTVTGSCNYNADRSDAFTIKLEHNHGSNRDIIGTKIRCWLTIEYLQEPT